MSATLLAVLAALPLGAGGPGGGTAVKEVEKALASLNEAFAKQDAAAIKRLTTADHVAVTGYYGGPQTRDEQLKSLKDLKLTEYAAGKVTVKLLGKDAALVTYPLTLKGTFQGKAVPARNFASAVWVRREGRWREAFYQETPLSGEARRQGEGKAPSAGSAPPAPRYEIDAAEGRVLRRDAGGAVRWAVRLGGSVGGPGKWRALVWDAKRVYVRHNDGVTALSATTGVVLWHARGANSLLLPSGDVLLAVPGGSKDSPVRRVTARTALTGAEIDTGPLPPGVVAGLRVGEDRVLLSDRDVVRMDLDQTACWRTPLTLPAGEGKVTGRVVELPCGDLVALLYRPAEDSGAHLVRLKAATGKVVWRARCAPLGLAHSKFIQYATAAVEGIGLHVTCRATPGVFDEVLDLRTGRQLRRTSAKR
jgi:ketosteroid isomerase-like protein